MLQLLSGVQKINVEIVKSDIGSDPASVAFKSFEYAKQNNADYCVIDTAGRLQNKKNLMEEFSKIIRVLKKIDNDAPHETILVLDATTGQNAINQIEEFKKITPITGIIMTKLDGTAKGGILVAIAKQFKIPIYAIGIGEKEEDLERVPSDQSCLISQEHLILSMTESILSLRTDGGRKKFLCMQYHLHEIFGQDL